MNKKTTHRLRKIIPFFILFALLINTLIAQIGYYQLEKNCNQSFQFNQDLLEFHQLSPNHTPSSAKLYSRNALKQRLDSLHQKKYDSVLMEFVLNKSEHFKYDNQGRLKEFMLKNSELSVGIESKITYEYNFNNLIEEIESRWDEDRLELTPYSKIVSQYNGKNQKKGSDYYLWDITNSQWLLNQNEIIAYHQDGQIDSVVYSNWDGINMAWIADFKTKNQFSDQSLIESSYELEWNSNSTTWDSTLMATFQYNTDQKLILKSLWFKSGLDWIQSSEVETDYPPVQEGYIETGYFNNFSSPDLVPFFRNEFIFQDGIPILTKHENWNIDSAKWILTFEEIGTIESGNLDNSIQNYFDRVNGTLTARSKREHVHDNNYSFPELIIPGFGLDEVYLFSSRLDKSNIYEWSILLEDWISKFETEFFYSEFDLTNTNEVNREQVQLYPNPSDGLIKIKDPNFELIAAQFFLYDSSGKRILNQLIGPQKTINIGNIPAGVYVYKLTNDGITITGKIILK